MEGNNGLLYFVTKDQKPLFKELKATFSKNKFVTGNDNYKEKILTEKE